MIKRLQVLLDDAELRELQGIARRQGLTTAEWVRRSLRAARRAESGGDAGDKLAAIAKAATYGYPADDIETMLEEIERGYGTGSR